MIHRSLALAALVLAAPSTAALAQQVLFFDDMEAGFVNFAATGDWYVADALDACASQTLPFPSGGQVAHANIEDFSPPFCGFGSSNSNLTLTTGVPIPATATSARLTFWSFEEGEGQPFMYDRPTVRVSADGGPFIMIWEGPQEAAWYQPCIDLTAYVGQTVVVQFQFVPMDHFANDTIGWQIDDVAITIDDVSSYCTAGSSASGCQALLSATGIPSASAPSGFAVQASTVEGNKAAFFYYGFNGAQAQPWGNGTSYQCVVPPVKRTPLLPGVGTIGGCDGSFAFDLNAFWSAASPSKKPAAGQQVNTQMWYRDPASTSNLTRSLSDALSYFVCP